MLDAQTQARVTDVERRMRERGVVDVKFFKDHAEYARLTPTEQMNQICDVLECMLNGRTSPAPPLGDSVRGLLGGDSSSPNTLSPVARCGGGRQGDQHEKQEKSGKTAS